MLILIAGVSRCGKSTLAKRIAQDANFEYLPFDTIVSTIQDIFPETGLVHSDLNKEISPLAARFLKRLALHLNYEGVDAVTDTYQLFPTDYMKQELYNSGPALWLGYPGIDEEKKVDDIRRFEESGDWSADLDNTALLHIVSDYLRESREIYRQCLHFGLPFFATSPNFYSGIEGGHRYLKREIEKWRVKLFDRNKKL